jgi:hypothetical protein
MKEDCDGDFEARITGYKRKGRKVADFLFAFLIIRFPKLSEENPFIN